MKKLASFALMLLSAISIGAFAQEADMSWMEKAPDKYLPAATRTITTATSPCNQHGEAFKDFIPKFRTDKSFRNSRLRLTDEQSKMSAEALDSPDGWEIGWNLFKASKKNTRCDKSYGTWFNVSANELCFIHQDVLLCDEWGGSTAYARFQRIGGQWYLTALMLAG